MDTKSLGRYGEELAVRFLERKGCWLLERNFKNKLGEIDLIVRDGGVICFVEVKTRRSLSCGRPQESVHWHKQRKIIRIALSYLQFKFRSSDVLSRFDIISIYQDPAGQDPIEHIVNAFYIS